MKLTLDEAIRWVKRARAWNDGYCAYEPWEQNLCPNGTNAALRRAAAEIKRRSPMEPHEDRLVKARGSRAFRLREIRRERRRQIELVFVREAHKAVPAEMPAVTHVHYNGALTTAVVHYEGWVEYSRRHTHYRKASVLVLLDMDSLEWRSIRVRPHITDLSEALDSIMPVAVRRAIEADKDVKRQGDIYFVPQRTWNLSALDEWSHRSYRVGDGVVVGHEEHGALCLDTPHKAYNQVQFNAGGRAD